MCGKITNNENGSVEIYIVSIIIIFIMLIVCIFAIAILFFDMYSSMYNLKIDLYNLNRNALMSVNIEKGSLGIYDYARQDYINKFQNMLKKAYFLNENFENVNRSISKVEIIEYIILNNGDMDTVKNKSVTKTTIHCVCRVTYIPNVFGKIFDQGFKIMIHNDISLKEYNG